MFKKWFEQQVKSKSFAIASEFMRDLLRQQQARQVEARARIDDQLLEGLDSGPSAPVTKKTWQRIQSEGIKLARNTRKK